MSRKWSYVNTFQEDATIEYLGTHLLIKDKYERKVSFEEFFEQFYPVATLEIDYEIFKIIVCEQKMPNDWPIELQFKWKFWQAFNNQKITAKQYPIDHKSTLHINQYGIYESYAYESFSSEQIYTNNEQRFHQFFFDGPRTAGLPLNVRLELKQAVFQALDLEIIDFDIHYGFPMFDYDKIEEEYWEINRGPSGEFISTKAHGKFTVGGWSSPRDGGANYRSIESVWYNPKNEIPSSFHYLIPDIKKILEKAIIDNPGYDLPHSNV